MVRNLVACLLASALLLPSTLGAQSADDLAREAADPIANLISLPFQLNVDGGLGEYDRARSILNIQPVIPFFDGKVVTRTIVPLVWFPDINTESESLTSGVADVLFTAFYVTRKGAFQVGLGPAIELPIGGEKRGSQKWSAGPSFVILTQPGSWTLGGLINNVWSFAGDSDAPDVNKGIFQYFIAYQLGGGWYVNSAPILSFNWKAADGNKWVVPFGIGAGKVLFLGKLPLNGQVGAYYNAVKPDIGPDWQLRFQLQLLFPAGG